MRKPTNTNQSTSGRSRMSKASHISHRAGGGLSTQLNQRPPQSVASKARTQGTKRRSGLSTHAESATTSGSSVRSRASVGPKSIRPTSSSSRRSAASRATPRGAGASARPRNPARTSEPTATPAPARSVSGQYAAPAISIVALKAKLDRGELIGFKLNAKLFSLNNPRHMLNLMSDTITGSGGENLSTLLSAPSDDVVLICDSASKKWLAFMPLNSTEATQARAFFYASALKKSPLTATMTHPICVQYEGSTMNERPLVSRHKAHTSLEEAINQLSASVGNPGINSFAPPAFVSPTSRAAGLAHSLSAFMLSPDAADLAKTLVTRPTATEAKVAKKITNQAMLSSKFRTLMLLLGYGEWAIKTTPANPTGYLLEPCSLIDDIAFKKALAFFALTGSKCNITTNAEQPISSVAVDATLFSHLILKTEQIAPNLPTLGNLQFAQWEECSLAKPSMGSTDSFMVATNEDTHPVYAKVLADMCTEGHLTHRTNSNGSSQYGPFTSDTLRSFAIRSTRESSEATVKPPAPPSSMGAGAGAGAGSDGKHRQPLSAANLKPVAAPPPKTPTSRELFGLDSSSSDLNPSV